MDYFTKVKAKMSAEIIMNSSINSIKSHLEAKDKYIKFLESEIEKYKPEPHDIFEGRAKENSNRELKCETCWQRKGKTYCPVVKLFRSIHCKACEFHKTRQEIADEEKGRKIRSIENKKNMMNKMKKQLEQTKKESAKQNIKKGIEKLEHEIIVLEKEVY